MVIAGSYYICIFHKFTHNLFHFAFINTKICCTSRTLLDVHVKLFTSYCTFQLITVVQTIKKSINMRIIFIFYSTEYINNQSYSDSYNLCR